MNDKERFLAVARFKKPDYVPIFGFGGAPGMSGGVLKNTHDRLIANPHKLWKKQRHKD